MVYTITNKGPNMLQMKSETFISLQKIAGFSNKELADTLSISTSSIVSYRLGRLRITARIANSLVKTARARNKHFAASLVDFRPYED